MNLLSFDIEISDVFERKAHEEINKYAPFHISVAATVIAGGEDRLWYSADRTGKRYSPVSANHAITAA